MQSFQTATYLFSVSKPVKVTGNGIGGNRILETTSIGISLNHDFNKCLVHISFLLQSLYLKIYFLTSNYAIQLSKISENVQSKVILEKGACVPQRLGVLTPYMKDSTHFLT